MLENMHSKDHEKIREILSQRAAESISKDEAREVDEHLAVCDDCRRVAEEYKLLVDYGRALSTQEPASPSPETLWNHEQQKGMLLARLHSEEKEKGRVGNVLALKQQRFRGTFYGVWAATAATLVLATGLVSFHYGLRSGSARHREAISVNTQFQLQKLTSTNNDTAVQTELQHARSEALAAEQSVSILQSSMAKLQAKHAQLEAQNQELSKQLGANAKSLGTMAKAKDDISAQLSENDQQLHGLRQELQDAQDQHARDSIRIAGLEFKAQEIATQFQEKDEIIARQQEYLESDRDIRELMGARQLYIADIVDVDREGHNRRPFGRIFYTKGKSLIFYGFDLDQQPRVRNASVFKVWGQSDAQARPAVSLGIFYLDSESNHRWVLKADNPKLLAQLDAVFVTVEKNSEIKQPTGKPFLYTYLRKGSPNHP